MKTKYATLIRSLLQNYHAQANAIEKETFSVHSDGLQLMELNIQLAKCLEGITSTARFNNDSDDFEELHKITLMVFSGNIPTDNNISGLMSLATSALKSNNSHLKSVAASQR
ncbi:hypothetical protein RZ761_24030 [Klebsiella pasteurii]|uniref:Uncharacterized protein n=1 Tax=Klebsiella pasteurii TaxID=2587529 RepID=A0ABT5CWC7_9ENTR|nr:hypothetical protein [Klebsiella pasteurii]MDC0695864.1 hypothetical protein [Klebsiella pasteurii]MDC0758069.1 hypothetical protein [Klebsiella pasteurii]MDQ2170912.1 hypothetical protein [Klebsiella pasteurii]MDQ2203224.1 hypothetical protein [Klebsiella pasteurii]MDQ2227147.1 hypothetical protein [Klebsiella pasteurii]